MSPKRRNRDPLATSDQPRWLKVQDEQWNKISVQRLEPGTDLRKAMREEAARWQAMGWTIEGEPTSSTFFMRREGDRRRLVYLTPGEHPLAAHGVFDSNARLKKDQP